MKNIYILVLMLSSATLLSSYAQDCSKYIFVRSGAIDTDGTAQAPTNLRHAISLANNNRNHIMIAGEEHVFNSSINLKSGIIIEGGYDTLTWAKTNTTPTIIRFTNQSLESINADVEHLVGFKSNGLNNWTLQDLEIRVDNVTGQTPSGRGRSVYGVWINNSSNYSFVRTRVLAGNASPGADGAPGLPGHVGVNGQIGQDSGGSCNDSNNRMGGAGGQGNSNVWGSTGGAGGKGGNATANGVRFRGCAGLPGQGLAPGNGGFPGPNAGICDAETEGECGCAPHNQGSAPGSMGGAGSAGQNATPPVAPSTHIFADFYIPSGQGISGSNGSGGGGGGGGESGKGERTCFAGCINNYGNGGGGGGQGGGGGEGGKGGFGGGSSFAVYSNNSNTGANFIQSEFIAGTAGAGGQGGVGGAGGQGGLGGAANTNCADHGRASGAGGNGGNGGNGGKGQDGAPGVSAALWVVSSGVGNPSESLDSDVEISVNAGNHSNINVACTFSEIRIQKSTGVWSIGASNPAFVNDLSPSQSSFNNGSDNALIFFTSTGIYDLAVGNNIFRDFVRVTESRTPPVINNLPDTIQTGMLTTITTPTVAEAYEWRIIPISNPTQAITFSTQSGAWIPEEQDSYFVRLRTRDACCGWSIPVFTKVDVVKVGIEENDILSRLNIFPNPVSDNLNLEFYTEKLTNFTFRITDLSGRVLDAKNANNIVGYYNTTMNVNHLPAGFYFLNIVSEKGIITRKIVKN